jgi:hypothetical protein
MMPGVYDFEVYRGDDWSEDFKIFQPGSDTLAQNLTGYTASAQIKALAEDVAAVATMTVTFAGDRSTGIINLAIAAEDLDVGAYVYDVQLTNAASKKQTYIRGAITVRQDVTRP